MLCFSIVKLVTLFIHSCSVSIHVPLLSFLLIHFNPFFPSVWLLLCLCQAFYGGGVGRTAKPQDAHTQSWYTLYSINSAHSKHFPNTHTRNSLTHNPLLTGLTPPSTQTAWAPLHSASVWQICSVLNIHNYFLQVSSQSCSLRRSLLIPQSSGSTKRRW